MLLAAARGLSINGNNLFYGFRIVSRARLDVEISRGRGRLRSSRSADTGLRAVLTGRTLLHRVVIPADLQRSFFGRILGWSLGTNGRAGRRCFIGRPAGSRDLHRD